MNPSEKDWLFPAGIVDPEAKQPVENGLIAMIFLSEEAFFSSMRANICGEK
jgi:hypothetical protein